MILAVDPGLRGCGAAFFSPQGCLFFAAYVENPLEKGGGPVAWRLMAAAVGALREPDTKGRYNVTHLLLEIPRIYPKAAQRKGDLNDLLELAGVQGAMVAQFPTARITPYLPFDWKGNIPKDVCTSRIQKSLTAEEHARIVRVGAKDHNTFDAVGIGLFYFRRLHKRASEGDRELQKEPVREKNTSQSP